MDINRIYRKEMTTYPMRLLVLLIFILALVPMFQNGRMTQTAQAARDYGDFLDALGMRESTNNYKAVNRFNYMGRYQMGRLALKDAGFMDKDGHWTALANSYGIYSQRDFLNAPAAQDAAVTAYHKKLWFYIRHYQMDQYLGQVYCNVTVTPSGLLAACHLVGVGSMKKALASGKPAYDGNRVQAAEYMKLFGDYDVSVLWAEDPPEETAS